MKKKVKTKSNPFLIITGLLIVIFVAIFVVKLIYFTAKETAVVLDTQKTNLNITKERELVIPINATANEKEFNYRKNWKEFINIPPLHKDVNFAVSKEGKIINLYIPIVNQTESTIESITIKIHFINSNDRNTIETQILEVNNIVPNNRISFKGPVNNTNGISVLCEIIKVRSKNLEFCYDEEILKDAQAAGGVSGDPNDPWHCK